MADVSEESLTPLTYRILLLFLIVTFYVVGRSSSSSVVVVVVGRRLSQLSSAPELFPECVQGSRRGPTE
eukprot:1862825-Pyramimonas_sp.AAC.1